MLLELEPDHTYFVWFLGESRRKPVYEIYNANEILPDVLVKELQKYVQAGYIYIPAKSEQHRSWGELSGYRRELERRNKAILAEYHRGVTVGELADR